MQRYELAPKHITEYVRDRAADREKLARDVQAFLDCGGRITEIPRGFTAEEGATKACVHCGVVKSFHNFFEPMSSTVRLRCNSCEQKRRGKQGMRYR